MWFPDLQDFLRETQTMQEVNEPGLTPAKRENDQHIMDHVLELRRSKRKIKIKIQLPGHRFF